MATKNEDTDSDYIFDDEPIIFEREWFNMFNELEDTLRKAAIAIITAMLVGAFIIIFFK